MVITFSSYSTQNLYDQFPLIIYKYILLLLPGILRTNQEARNTVIYSVNKSDIFYCRITSGTMLVQSDF